MRIIMMDDNNKLLGDVETKPKVFSTGSRGYVMYGKITIDGKRHQVAGNIIEIGSKKHESK